MRAFVLLVAFSLFTAAVAAQTRDRTLNIQPSGKPSEARHALVIGNSAYTQGPLKNPVNDARAMAKALGAAGFHVRVVEDATHLGMQRAVRLWGSDIAKGGVGLFYYAGHGLQVKGRNFLVPVNADIADEEEIEFATLDVNQVLSRMDSAKNALNIVILDACRNNPFARSFRSASRGLAQMDAPTGTFIAFATAPGSVASDGTGENGLYTQHLLREMQQPGVPIELLFKQVRNGVMSDTKGQQIPWESSSMRGDFSFRPGAPVVALAAPVAAAAPAAAPSISLADMEKMIQAALDKQRAMLEAQGLKMQQAAPPAPPKPAGPDPREKEFKAAAEKAAAERAAAEKMLAEARETSRKAAEERAAAQKAVAELAAAQKVAADQAGAARLAAERAAAERVASEKVAAERRAAAERAKAEQVQVALAAPVVVLPATAGGRLPLPGDSWTYQLSEPKRTDGPKQRKYVVKVTAASSSAILESYSLEGEPSKDWVHAPGNYLVGLGASLYSPYLAAFQDLPPRGSLGRVAINDAGCTVRFLCEASAKVVGRETVRVPAGSFETIKIEVEHEWRPFGNVFQQASARAVGGRTMLIWYSPEAKRAVKFRSRLNVGEFTPIEPDFDLELTSYQIK